MLESMLRSLGFNCRLWRFGQSKRSLRHFLCFFQFALHLKSHLRHWCDLTCDFSFLWEMLFVCLDKCVRLMDRCSLIGAGFLSIRLFQPFTNIQIPIMASSACVREPISTVLSDAQRSDGIFLKCPRWKSMPKKRDRMQEQGRPP